MLAISYPKETSLAIVEKLVKAGGNINYKDKDGATALSYAIAKGELPVKLLKTLGADVDMALSVITKIKIGTGKDAKYEEKTLKEILSESDKAEIQEMKKYLADYL